MVDNPKKQAGNDTKRFEGEIAVIIDKLFVYKCNFSTQQNMNLTKFSLTKTFNLSQKYNVERPYSQVRLY